MPTYEFRCPDGTVIEKFFKISEVPDTIPLPDGTEAVRMISGGAGLVFKGSGFYITDYGKDGKKDMRQATSKPGASAASGDSAASTASAAPGAEGAASGSKGSTTASASAASASTAPATSGSAA